MEAAGCDRGEWSLGSPRTLRGPPLRCTPKGGFSGVQSVPLTSQGPQDGAASAPTRLLGIAHAGVGVYSLRGARLSLCVARFPLSLRSQPSVEGKRQVKEAGTELRLLLGIGWVPG